jgi:RHS repeat-associated protein
MGKGMMDTFALNGNRVTGGSTARKGWTVYRHDSRGNLSLEASFAWVADTGNLALAWRVVESRFNKRNELVRVRVINRMPAADTTWLRFEYGEDGNRILSAMGKGSDTSSWLVTHKWVYDGSVIAADSGSDHSWTWHAYNGLNRVAEATDSAGRARVRYVLTDHQGTVQALLSDTGAVLGHWVWDPWGNIEESWTQRTTDLLYQGKPYETALNQYYWNKRWYSPERAAYTGRDIAKQFWTPYGFAGNGPLTGTDPDGNVFIFTPAAQAQYSSCMSSCTEGIKSWLTALADDPKFTVTFVEKMVVPEGEQAHYQNVNREVVYPKGDLSPEIFVHELRHAWQDENGLLKRTDGKTPISLEVDAFHQEFEYANKLYGEGRSVANPGLAKEFDLWNGVDAVQGDKTYRQYDAQFSGQYYNDYLGGK